MDAPLAPQQEPEAASPAAPGPATPPVVTKGYVRPPGRDIPGLTRAHPDGAVTAPEGSATPSVPFPRPAADAPGITRAHLDEAASPAGPGRAAPLFSTEGLVRQAEVGRLRGGGRGRKVGALLLAGLAGVLVLGFAPAAVLSLLPNNTAIPGSPGAPVALVLAASANPVEGSSPGSATSPSAAAVAAASPTSAAVLPTPAYVATATTKPGPPAPTRVPTMLPTPMPTQAPTPPPTPHPTPAPTPGPTVPPTPTPTPIATPTPVINVVAFEPAGSVKGGRTATYSVPQGTNFTFIIDGLGGATCKLSSNPHMPGSPASRKVPGTAPQLGWIAWTSWGMNWPAGTYVVTATCTFTGQPTATATQLVYVT